MKASSELYFSRLDHLRFLAALLVLVWHSVHCFVPPSYKVPHLLFALSWFEEGHTGVSLFLVLSGYIFMTICHHREMVYRDFLRNRILRIAPLFLFWLTLQLWLQPNVDVLKMLGSLLTMTSRNGEMPGVGWTILIEFQFYLLFPFLLGFYHQSGYLYLVRLLCLFVVLRLLVAISGHDVQQLAYWSLFGRMDQFLLGMIFACWAIQNPEKFSSLFYLMVLFFGLLVFYHLFNHLGGFYDLPPKWKWLWAILPTGEGLFYAALTAHWLHAPLTLPRWLDEGLAWLGKLSFSFYLNHLLVIGFCAALARKFAFLPNSFLSSLLYTLFFVLPVLTAFSALTYYWIELPFLQMRRKYVRAIPARPAEPTETRHAA
jgi:peptidoglycan/LPS O-acetylase OafA/YrhL